MSVIRQVVESPLVQGVDENIIYSIRTTQWGSSPSNVDVKVYDITAGDYTDVTTTVVTGVAGVVGDVITLPKIGSLTAVRVYKVEVYFESGSQDFECYLIIQAED